MDRSTTFSTTATFDVPVHGRDPGHVFPYENALTALLELKSYPTHIRRLTLGPISPLELPYVQHTLSSFDQPLDALEELRIVVRYPYVPPSAHDVPELKLRAGIFPSLHTLSLDGVYMAWENVLFAQLTRVELRNCPGSSLAHLVDFLDVLPTWTSLTELHLSKFLTMSDGGELMLQDTGYIMRPRNLRTLVVEDRIYQMSHILYHLDVPGPGAQVRLTGYAQEQHADDDRSPFAAMMPLDDNFPAIFKSARHVELTVTAHQARILGVSPGGTLTLDVPDLDRSKKGALPDAFRSALTSLVDIFAARSAPVCTLSLVGDISKVSEQDWAMVFQAVCPQLRELVVRDIGQGECRQNLFMALTHVFERNQTVTVCPDLQRLKFTGAADASGGLLSLVDVALRHRIELGRPPLRGLELGLFIEDIEHMPPSMVELYRQGFMRWIAEVKVEVRPLQTSNSSLGMVATGSGSDRYYH
ncbi:hypothetical protein C8T65DRAFT_828619 [Cerioporus squamosus]|nr:hypothetical protein C8T65DRAFT_828619 [Cerioporus squamosus]